MQTLQGYISQVQSLVHDQLSLDFSQADLISKINQARTRVALDLHCCRTFFENLQFLPGQERYPLSGGVGGVELKYGGQNYAAPMVVFAGGGGFGASATAVQTGGVITSITMTSWGQNYTTTPSVNIIDGAGWVTNWQLRTALAAIPNASQLVYNAIIALPAGNAVQIQWNTGAPSLPGDALYLLIQSTLSLMPAQTAALYAAAAVAPTIAQSSPFGAGAGQTTGVQAGQTSLAGGYNAPFAGTSVTNQQIRLALASQGLIAPLFNALSTSRADPANIIWYSGSPSSPNDALAALLVASLGLSQDQVTRLYESAATQPRAVQTVTAQQLQSGLNATGQLAAVLAAMPSSLSDPANIQWFSCAGSTNAANDPLAVLIGSVTSATAVYASAATFPVNSPGSGAVAQAIAMRNVVDWNQVAVIWGTERPTLSWLPFSMFEAYARLTQSVPQGRPVIWTSYPEDNWGRVFRIPDQPYGAEIDAIVLPDPLENATDVDFQVRPPNDDCVQFYAAALCLMKLQQFGPAKWYEDKYMSRALQINASKVPVRVQNIYASSGARMRKWY